MKGLLLGRRALKEMIAGVAILSDWLEAQGDTPLHTTCVSVALLLASAEGLLNVTSRRAWVDKLTNNVPSDFGPRLHGFDMNAAKQWSAIKMNLPPEAKIVEADLYIVAVALAEELDYVAPREGWHEKIRNLRQHDPWNSKSYPN